MKITTEQIKDLRNRTGVSIMECRKALEETNGDIEKAIVLLKKKGADVAAKKGGRSLGAGTIVSYIHSNNAVGVLIELSSETDFVSNTEEFKKLAYDIALHIAAMNPAYVRMEDVTAEAKEIARGAFAKEVEGKKPDMQEKIMEGKLSSYFGERVLLAQPFVKNPEITIQGLVDDAVHKFGEKIEVRRFVRYKVLE